MFNKSRLRSSIKEQKLKKDGLLLKILALLGLQKVDKVKAVDILHCSQKTADVDGPCEFEP